MSDAAVELHTLNTIGKSLNQIENNFPKIINKTKSSRGTKLSIKYSSSEGYANEYARIIGGDSTGSLGFYDAKNNPKITIGEWNAVGSDLTNTMRHELGHPIHWNALSQDQFAEWYKLFKSEDKEYWAKKVSKYASESSSELFAESFTAYTSEKYKTGILPIEIEKFFKKIK